MLSILVGHSYFLRLDSKQFARAQPYPPLATLQVAAWLRREGHEVACFDAMLARGPQDFDTQLANTQPQPQAVLLYEDNYNFLSKMCLGTMRRAALQMVASARRAGVRILVVGSDASDAPEPYLHAGADVVLRGEGLDALPALLRRLEARPDMTAAEWIDGLPNTVALVQGQLCRGVAPSTISWSPKVAPDAELQAPAAWDLVDIGHYRSTWIAAHGYFSLNMAASKGCSFRCAWCAKPIWGSRYQQRSSAAVAAEMAELKRRHAPDHIWFADDIFGFKADWVQRFAAELQARGGGIPFTVQTRADLVSEAMALALRDAGCREAWIGAESGSQKVLDAMHKGTTVAEIMLACQRLQAVGVRVGFFIQLGYLGEGLEELLQTRHLVEQARPDAVGVSVAYPLPGTPFHEQVQAQLGAKTHWDDSADLAMMFQGSFDTAFYRSVRDLLHAQVDLGRLDTDAQRASRLALRQRWAQLLDSVSPAEAAALMP